MARRVRMRYAGGVVDREDALTGIDPAPPIPLAEWPEDQLSLVIDQGNLEAVDRALREQVIRLPDVVRQLDRVLAAGSGNLGCALATMLIGQFHVAQANAIADRALAESATAGADELVDLAAALIQQERLAGARRVLDTVLARNPRHDRGLYLLARLLARRGDPASAFEAVCRANPKALGPFGMAIQARYALLAGRPKGYAGAIKHALDTGDADAREHTAHVQRIKQRLDLVAPTFPLDLRAAVAVEYGSFLVELAVDARDGGRLGPEPMTYGDAGRLIRRIAPIIARVTPKVNEFLFATEDGEIVAAGLSKLLDRPNRAWRKERPEADGDWLCMGSAATHPHMPNDSVLALDRALKNGVLRTVALVLPAGWRAPIAPDIIGRFTGDDDFPWQVDDEVEAVYEAVVAAEPTVGLVDDDDERLDAELSRFLNILRATHHLPRPGHVAYDDETPVARVLS